MPTLSNYNLLDLFAIPNTYNLSEGTARYYSSLTPKWDVIKNLKTINFIVSFDNLPQGATELAYHNSINTHLFKPKFFVLDNKHRNIYCMVPNIEVLAHTLRSLAVISYHLGNKNIKVSVQEKNQKYSDYCKGWEIEDRVILGWRDSFLKFLKVFWLLQNNIEQKYVEKLVQELENRLKEPDENVIDEISEILYKEKGLRLSDFEKHFKITYQNSSTPCIAGANLEINGVKISIVQLTWGLTLSRQMMQSLLDLNPHIKKVGSVGGVGYGKADELQLDDIFLPKGLIVPSKSGKLKAKPITNHIFTVQENTYFKNKKVSTGNMKTVVPQIGVLSNTATFKDYTDLISGFDMELEGFLDVLEKYPNIEYASSHYIMDIPFRGYSLGDTYYYKPYLEKFFKTFNRGKYYCFERILNFAIA